MQKNIFLLQAVFDEVMPEHIRPTLFNVVISTANVEFCVKMISLTLSTAYLIYKWHNDIKNKRK
jgi:hypothetical protein